MMVWLGVLGIVALMIVGRTPDDDTRRTATARQSSGTVPESAIQWPQRYGANRNAALLTEAPAPSFNSNGPAIVWEQAIGTGYGSPVTSQGRVVQLHRINDDEVVSCFDGDDGALIWEHRYPTTFQCDYEYSSGPSGSPVIVGNQVFVIGGQHQTFCLNFENGQVIWRRDLGEEYSLDDLDFAVGSCPLVIDGRLIYNLGAGFKEAGIIALDCQTGQTIWTATDHSAGYCSPIAAEIHGQSFVFVMTNRGLVSLDPMSGLVDWELDHHPRSDLSYNSTSPAVSGDLVLAVTGPGPGAICVRVNPDRSYELVWKDRRVLDSQFNTLVTRGRQIIGFTAKRQGGSRLRCIDIKSGDVCWEHESDLGRGQAILINSTLLLTGESGHLARINLNADQPGEVTITDSPVVSQPLYTSPAILNDRLYLKDEDRLVCFRWH